jgi:hypothetical protein
MPLVVHFSDSQSLRFDDDTGRLIVEWFHDPEDLQTNGFGTEDGVVHLHKRHIVRLISTEIPPSW